MPFGHIYKITFNDNDIYYGSTDNVKKRWSQHKNKNTKCVTKYKDFTDANFEIIETIQYQYTNYEVLERERYYIKNFKCINVSTPLNKNICNKKHTCECGGKYTETSKEVHLQSKKHQFYLQNNKPKKSYSSTERQISYKCKCGGRYNVTRFQKHCFTNRHQNYLVQHDMC
jgi:predicted GIY-YIG superfamily endonuclease